jgi:hypothetical protein
MGNAWYVSSPTEEICKWIENQGLAPPPIPENAADLTPQQLFKALESFPEYRVAIRGRTWKNPKKEEKHSIYLDLRREDGTYAIEINLHQPAPCNDDQPAVVVFAYYRETEELMRIVAKLAEVCGPLILWHDGGEPSVVVYPTRPT